MSSPHPQSKEIFRRLLNESAARLVSPESAGIAIPDDALHREIIVPLLPAMLGDKSIRQHWSEQAATGFPARLARHLDGGEPAPRWLPGDFEIHVTASYSAGADARALADTLLSEESLRDMTAALMNQLLDVLWPSPPPAVEVSAEEIAEFAAAETSSAEISAPAIATPAEAPAAAEIPGPLITTEQVTEPLPEVAPQILPSAIPPSAIGMERAGEIQPLHQPPSRAIIRALCGKLSASAVQRGLAAHGACSSSAAIFARRILQRDTVAETKTSRPTSPPRLPRRASL
ncbi:MAG: hypothetical protein ABI318_04435 [Chthoniobacteraceae bacterium]